MTTTPSWVSTLSNASIAADMAAADVNGTVTYSGLKTLLTDIDATLSSSNSKLTASEFSDLMTIVANLNNGMTTSSYLTGIMNDLVNGNAANATWTGGNATSTTLGNLAAGSTSATQLNELIGKWFLGTDLPSSTVAMSGYNTYSVSYSAVSSPLFGASGPSMNDVNQGYLGDCYLLSSLAEVADKNSGTISSMFTSNGNNTYGVRFYVNGVAEYVTVNNELADGGNEFNHATDIWASLAEKAYAQLQASGVVTGNSVNYGNSFSTIGNGGAPEYALEEITGASKITDFYASGSSWTTYVYNSSFGVTSYSNGSSTSSVLATLASDLAVGDDVILSSYTNATDSSGRTTLVADHAMSIYGYDSSTGMIEIRNPWGTASGQYWDTTFEVSLSTLLSAGDTITADNMGGGAQTAAPTITDQTSNQTWYLGKAVSFALASNTFTDPQSETLTYSATLANGSALPSWLTFNASTRTFSGTPPAGAASLSIKVTATDTGGASNSETFTANLVAPSAPVVTAQTGAQVWALTKAVNFTLASNTFTDPQGEALTYTATLSNGAALPSWLSFNAATRTFTGTPPTSANGLTIKVTATDAGGASASETFAVTDPASPPTIADQTATQTWTRGKSVSFTLASNTFTDPQGETLTYSATQANGSALPSWLSFNAATKTFTGTPPAGTADMSIKVTATDTGGASNAETFAVNFAAPSAPVVTAQTASQVWAMTKAVNFTLASNTFTDPLGEALTYTASLSNGSALPSWLTFNAATRTFTGTVPTNAAGLSIKVTATDAGGASASETFTVTDPASPPTITGQTATQTWTLGKSVSFTLASNTFMDPQGETLTYAATLANGSALPSWLAFNAATKTFSGTPPAGTAGLSLKVTATDTGGASNAETFAVNFVAPSAPTNTSKTASQTWTEGQAVNLALPSNTFTDPQGEKLTYAASQSNGSALPTWLTFNATTDTFTGTAPNSASTLTLKVTAADAGGASASETFSVSIVAAAGKLAGGISGMVGSAGSGAGSFTSGSSNTQSPIATPSH
jgi:trimeric autotransporter adhesin